MRRALAAGVVAALSGCSLFTSFDGFRDDVVILVEGGAPDAADARGAGDAPAGAGPTDASPGSFCTTLSPAPYFCSDFDDGTLPGPWSSLVAAKGGSVTVEDGVMVAFVPSASSVDARLELILNGARTELTIEVDVAIDAMPEPNADLIHLGGDDRSRELSIEIDDGELRLDQDEPSDGGSDIEVKTRLGARIGGAFAHLEWRLRATSATVGTSEVIVDGLSTGVLPVSAVAFAESTILEIGEKTVYLSAPMRARYDNFVVRLK